MKSKNIGIYIISGLLLLFIIAFFVKQNSTASAYQPDMRLKKDYTVNGSTVEVSYTSRKSSFISATLNRDYDNIRSLVLRISKKEPSARQINVNITVPWCTDNYGNQTPHSLTISWYGDELSEIRKYRDAGLLPYEFIDRIADAGIHCGDWFIYPASCKTYYQC
jgi:hypothetical protein